MGLSFSIGLPGPFRYSKRIGTRKRRKAGEGLLTSLFLLPIRIVLWPFAVIARLLRRI